MKYANTSILVEGVDLVLQQGLIKQKYSIHLLNQKAFRLLTQKHSIIQLRKMNVGVD